MFAVPYHSTFEKSVTTCDVLRTYPKKSIKYLYNYFSGTWIKVTSHANLGCYRVWGARRGAVGHARARRPCPAVTLRPWSRPPAPRAPRAPPRGWPAPARLRPPSGPLSPERPRSTPRAKFNTYLYHCKCSCNKSGSKIYYEALVTIKLRNEEI